MTFHIYASWNGILCNQCAYESVNFPPNETGSFVDNLLYFPPLNVFLPRQSQVVAYHFFLYCQYRFSSEYATILCSLENYMWIVSLGLRITALSLDNSWLCIS